MIGTCEVSGTPSKKSTAMGIDERKRYKLKA
jgi:hypothetical protein